MLKLDLVYLTRKVILDIAIFQFLSCRVVRRNLKATLRDYLTIAQSAITFA